MGTGIGRRTGRSRRNALPLWNHAMFPGDLRHAFSLGNVFRKHPRLFFVRRPGDAVCGGTDTGRMESRSADGFFGRLHDLFGLCLRQSTIAGGAGLAAFGRQPAGSKRLGHRGRAAGYALRRLLDIGGTMTATEPNVPAGEDDGNPCVLLILHEEKLRKSLSWKPFVLPLILGILPTIYCAWAISTNFTRFFLPSTVSDAVWTVFFCIGFATMTGLLLRRIEALALFTVIVGVPAILLLWKVVTLFCFHYEIIEDQPMGMILGLCKTLYTIFAFSSGLLGLWLCR